MVAGAWKCWTSSASSSVAADPRTCCRSGIVVECLNSTSPLPVVVNGRITEHTVAFVLTTMYMPELHIEPTARAIMRAELELVEGHMHRQYRRY